MPRSKVGPTRRNGRYLKRKRPSSRRRSYGKKRSTFRSKKMSKRRILNITSKKKQDNMLSFSNSASDGTGTTIRAGGLFANGLTPYAMTMFSPTARSLVTAGNTNLAVDTADRTASVCYMRGYKENLRIQTSSPLPWIWRRIVFTNKGATFQQQLASDTVSPKYLPYSDTSVGMARLWHNLTATGATNTIAGFNGVMFRGTYQQDWNDVITAKVDTSRITVMSDRCQTIRSSNNNGHFSERKLWYPMNKNIVYDDDEAGAAETPSYYSTDAKAGMGDVYIADYFVPGVGGAASDLINVNCTATLYWHEK